MTSHFELWQWRHFANFVRKNIISRISLVLRAFGVTTRAEPESKMVYEKLDF